MDDIPYLLRGVMPVGSDSSVLVSSSKYLNCAPLREWIAMIALKKNGPDFPAAAEMHELIGILNGLRDFDHIEAMFHAERKINKPLDDWFNAWHISDYTMDELKDCAPGTVGGIYHAVATAGNYQIQIVPFAKPRTQWEFFSLRSGQTHDYEHILCGGGFNSMGELIPYWYRLTNIHKHIHNKELAGEISVMSMLGTMRYIVRTLLHYPQIWETTVECMQRGMAVGQQSGPLFLAKLEDYWHVPLEEARQQLGIVGATDVDTEAEGAIWFNAAGL